MMKTDFRMFRHVGLVSLGTLSSRLLGLVREILMASTFGTKGVASAFFVAFLIPNLFRRLFGEGALSAAFVPHYIHLRDGTSPEKAAATSRSILAWMLRWLGTISLGGIIIASGALSFFNLPEDKALTLLSLRILLPYMIGICLAALMMGILNAHRKYALPAFTPCILNLMWIGVLVLLQYYPEIPLDKKVIWVCWAILLAGFIQFAVQALVVRKLIPSTPRPKQKDPEVSVILTRMAPAALGAAVMQVNVLADRLLAFWVADYGPATLSYSERLIYLPLGLFATALGTILLPEFSGQVQRKDRDQLTATLDRSLRVLSFIMLPAAVGLAVLASPIIRLVYERGEFDATSTLLTSRALLLYAPGLVVFSLAKVFVPLFHAHGDTKTPMKIGAFAVVLNLGFNLLFIFTFPEGWKHAGLAAGTVLSILVQVGILAFLSHRRYAPLHFARIGFSWARQGVACFPLAAVATLASGFLPELPELLHILVTICLSAAAYFFSTWCLRCPEWKELRDH